MTLMRRSFLAIRHLAVLLGWAVAVGVPTNALAERIALVVGNARYEHVPALATPGEDSRAVAEALRRLDFEVTLLSDVSTDMFNVVLEAFAKDARSADAVVFYYAGHAFHDAGENRLVPVEARLDRPEGLAAETWAMTDIAARLAGSGTTLIFLDACRVNPVPEAVRSAGMAARGLAEFDTPAGTFLAFSTLPGGASYDQGNGRYSPFAQAFLDHVERPGQSVSDLMIRVRNQVEVETVGRQVPWDQSSLRTQFYFAVADAQPGAHLTGGLAAAAAEDAALLALLNDIVADDLVLLEPVPAAAPVPVQGTGAQAPASPTVTAVVGAARLAATNGRRPAIPAVAGERVAGAGAATPQTRAASPWYLAPVAATVAAARAPGRAIAGLDTSAAPAIAGAGASLPPAPEDLPRALQAELRRIGCYRLSVDGDWGQGSRNAVRRYREARAATGAEDGLEPTEELWHALQREAGQVCAAPPAEPAVARKAAQKAKPAARATAGSSAGTPARRQPRCTFTGVAVVCS